ncbi:FecR domain-containing protein [Azorhizophilus paspali]|uniref:FecR domain-containing protein n=1 Tax=Azorhizophilus paspali TaxID=69963 RepID=UPI00362B2A90
MRDAPINPEIRDQAIAWFTLAQSGCLDDENRQRLEQWRRADAEHERAWQRLAGIPVTLRERAAQLRDPAAREAAERVRYRTMDRRQALKVLVGSGLLSGLAWAGHDSHWLQGALADLSTATGERRRHRLADGTELWLNTDSALDVRFDTRQRLLRLRHGEVDILTGTDPAGRPLLVLTGEASLRSLGTRFSVRRDDGRQGTQLGVSQGRVAVERPDGGMLRVVEAGWQIRIDTTGIHDMQPLADGGTAWIEGFSSPGACAWAISSSNSRVIGRGCCAAIRPVRNCGCPGRSRWTMRNAS